MNNHQPFSNFHTASQAVIQQLHELLGFDLWMVTRTSGEDWIVLEAADHGYGVEKGNVFRWADSFCSLMVQGRGPRIAPCSDNIVAYAAAPIGRLVKIGAYVGVPMYLDDGQLFGTLCAIHPTPRPAWIVDQLPHVELMARLLTSILQSELNTAAQTRLAERSQQESILDCLTGLYNRRGWDRFVELEEERCRRYGHPACMISLDLDGLKKVNDTQGHQAGDDMLQRAAEAIRSTIRSHDVAARIGGDEFAILATECDLRGSRELMERLESALQSNSVTASIGAELCLQNRPFQDSWNLADREMYHTKRGRTTRQLLPV